MWEGWDMKNKCAKLYDKTSQVGQFAHWPMHQRGMYRFPHSKSVSLSGEQIKISYVPIVTDYTEYIIFIHCYLGTVKYPY